MNTVWLLCHGLWRSVLYSEVNPIGDPVTPNSSFVVWPLFSLFRLNLPFTALLRSAVDREKTSFQQRQR